MDIFYYSNYCIHSKNAIETLAKNGILTQLNCICIDKRALKPQTNQMIVELENGKKVILPPNIHSVPSLLLVSKKYEVIIGEKDILSYFSIIVETAKNEATAGNGEPIGFSQNLSSSDLSYSTYGSNKMIETPPETFKSNRPTTDEASLSVEELIRRRDLDVPKPNVNPTVF